MGNRNIALLTLVYLFEIETVRDYSPSYMACIEEAKAELQSNARPELKQYLDSLDGYDNVFVCGPCWWGTYPMAVFTQLEKLDWAGKKVMALMTHEGSGLTGSERDLEKTCTGENFGKRLGRKAMSKIQTACKKASASYSTHRCFYFNRDRTNA